MSIEMASFLVLMIIQTVVVVAGFFSKLKGVEDGLRTYIEKMHKEQDERIRCAEKEASDIRNNYNTKFAGIHAGMTDNKVETIREIHAAHVETITKVSDTVTDMRKSMHNMRDDVTKGLNAMQLSFQGAVDKIASSVESLIRDVSEIRHAQKAKE
jgi:hypothetical protein